jgi:aminoglycoside 6'-N-acetyltransferase I
MDVRETKRGDEQGLCQGAALLLESFREGSPEWLPDLAAARAELDECFAEGHVLLGAWEERALVGLVGGRLQYDGHVCELHPLAVRADRRRRGIGRALVRALAGWAAAHGAATLLLGTDDETGATSLGMTDLYPAPLEHLMRLRNLREHPYSFYERVGFCVVGVIPDANGPGRPDILMAKRVAGEQAGG